MAESTGVPFTEPPSGVNDTAHASWSTIFQPGKSTTSERLEFYSSNAATYDEDMEIYDFGGPRVTAEAMHKVLQGRTDAYIIDVGAGTGRVIEESHKFAHYDNIDGLDASEGMLDIAKKKGLYKNIMHQYFKLDCGIPHNKYDAAVCCGAFVAAHFKSDCMIELCNILKPGGFVVVVMRREHLNTVAEYKANLRATVDGLVEQGKWRKIEDRSFPNFVYNVEGQLFVYQKI